MAATYGHAPCSCLAALRQRVPALGVARQSVVGDRLPDGGVGDELAHARPDSRVAVEGPHADPDRVGVARVIGVDLRAADAAEVLVTAALGLPLAQRVLAGDDPERPLGGERADRDGGAGAARAALAVAVAGLLQRRGHLEADRAAVASTCEHCLN